MRRRPALLVTLAVLGAALAGCGDDDSDGGTDGGTAAPPPATATPTETEGRTPPPGQDGPTAAPSPRDGEGDDDADDAAPPFPSSAGLDEREPAGGRLSPVDLRVGVHDGYDRVVLELAGDGEPGWRADYDDDPRNEGRGDPVEIDGSAVVGVVVTGVQYPTEEGAQEYRGPERTRPEAAGVVEDVRYGVLFEGQLQLWVGARAEQPFRVFRLADPPRLVVDVQHP